MPLPVGPAWSTWTSTSRATRAATRRPGRGGRGGPVAERAARPGATVPGDRRAGRPSPAVGAGGGARRPSRPSGATARGGLRADRSAGRVGRTVRDLAPTASVSAPPSSPSHLRRRAAAGTSARAARVVSSGDAHGVDVAVVVDVPGLTAPGVPVPVLVPQRSRSRAPCVPVAGAPSPWRGPGGRRRRGRRRASASVSGAEPTTTRRAARRGRSDHVQLARGCGDDPGGRLELGDRELALAVCACSSASSCWRADSRTCRWPASPARPPRPAAR